MARYSTKTGTTVTTDKTLGAGGEGTVYTIVGQPNAVAKIYHAHRLTKALADKVAAMVADPPDDESRNNPQLKHVSIAWPEHVLLNNGKFVGYVMPKIPKSDDLYDLLQPQQRAKQHPHADHRMIYRTARNFATAMAAIHRKKYVIGDVNFKNALFTDQALITIVDCDSMQVTDSKGTIHRCLVGLPEYTAPELQGADFTKVNRTTESDTFGLAVLIFQLLMQGFHPFAGRPLPGAPDVEQVHVYCIARKIFPYEQNTQFVPPNAAPPITALPGMLRALFQRAFTTAQRPSAQEWADALAMVENRLIQCPNEQSHWYPADGACVVCEVEYNVGRRKRTTATTQTTQMQVPYTAPKPVVTPASKSTPFTIPSPPSTPQVVPQPTPANSRTSSVSSTTPNQLYGQVTRFLQQRTSMVAVGIIVVSLFFMVRGWSSSQTATSSTTATDIQLIETSAAVNEILPTAIPTPETAAPTTEPTRAPSPIPVNYPACESMALLQSFWPSSMHSQLGTMQLSDWPQRISDVYGRAIAFQPIPSLPSLNGLTDQPLATSLTCTGGTVTRFSVDTPTDGAPVACDSTTCSDVQPLFREYSAVLHNGATPSNENFVIGKSSIARFFAVTGSKARYTVIVFDNTTDDFALFTRYQLPLIQHEFKAAKESELQASTISNAAIWYDIRAGIQSRTNANILEQYQRTITIPSGLTWINEQDVEAEDYVRWFTTCMERNTRLPACDYIADITVLNKQQIQVTYLPGIPREMARIIQPYAIPTNANTSQSSMATQLLADSMSDWRCLPLDTKNSWQCETVSSSSSSNAKVITFYRYAQLDEIKVAFAKPFDLMLASADVTPSFVTSVSLQSPIADYTLELVPTGAIYAVARQ